MVETITSLRYMNMLQAAPSCFRLPQLPKSLQCAFRTWRAIPELEVQAKVTTLEHKLFFGYLVHVELPHLYKAPQDKSACHHGYDH